MQLLTIGINHKTATIALRESLAFMPEMVSIALRELSQITPANEAVILSTCNRTEIYCNNIEAQQLSEWLSQKQNIALSTLAPHLYLYQDSEAIRHLMRVVCGLDSMIIGEPQIFGQVKSAYKIAQCSGTIGRQFNRIFQTIFAVGKQVRHKTGIGANPVSIASAVLNLAQQIFTRTKKNTVLLIGAGKTIELVTTHFHNKGITKIIIANRTIERATKLANLFDAQAITISEIGNILPQADIVISATTSPFPILGKGLIETAVKARKHRPMLMIDLAVPRDIEPEIASLEDIYLYHLDDFQHIISENLKNRSVAVQEAEALIETHVEHFMRELKALESIDIIRTYRENMSALAAKELAIALQQLKQGKSPELLLQRLAHNITRKILHKPTVRLREAALSGELELLLLAQKLWDDNAN